MKELEGDMTYSRTRKADVSVPGSVNLKLDVGKLKSGEESPPSPPGGMPPMGTPPALGWAAPATGIGVPKSSSTGSFKNGQSYSSDNGLLGSSASGGTTASKPA